MMMNADTSPTAPRVVVCGATGRTGSALVAGFADSDAVRLVACVAPSLADASRRALLPDGAAGFATLADALGDVQTEADVVIDVTHADAARRNLTVALQHRVPVVLGTTGLAQDELDDWGMQFQRACLALFVVPNFSLGAVLAMRVAEELAVHFPDVEIVELHHDGKRDAPSGTARHTAQRVARARNAGLAGALSEAGTSSSRGELIDGVPVHALRLPGATAHQSVIFGAPGELLTIRHDAIDRSCYAAGAARAARHAATSQRYETGLDYAL